MSKRIPPPGFSLLLFFLDKICTKLVDLNLKSVTGLGASSRPYHPKSTLYLIFFSPRQLGFLAMTQILIYFKKATTLFLSIDSWICLFRVREVSVTVTWSDTDFSPPSLKSWFPLSLLPWLITSFLNCWYFETRTQWPGSTFSLKLNGTWCTSFWDWRCLSTRGQS